MSDTDRRNEQSAESQAENIERTEPERPEPQAEEPAPEPSATEAEGAAADAEASAAEAGQPGAEEPAAGGPTPQPDDMNVFDLLRAVIPLFVQEAWIALGVQARPGSTVVRTDLRCARIAIDTTQALIEKLGDEATAEERRDFEHALTNLRINFVQRQSKAQS